MSKVPGWTPNIFNGTNFDAQLLNNENIASDKINEVLLARWLMFKLFIEVAKEVNDGVLNIPTTRRNWLIFQALPLQAVPPSANNTDPFSALHRLFPSKMSSEDLIRWFPTPTPESVLGSDFEPARFFYVLDEGQAAGELYPEAFSDQSHTFRRPVLHPIIAGLVQSVKVNIIVSGTGFPLDLFKPAISSSVGKVDEWDVHYETGDFSERTTHFAYLSQFFPSSFINSDAGLYLKGRIHEWLRGRYVAAIVLRRWLTHLTQT